MPGKGPFGGLGQFDGPRGNTLADANPTAKVH